ncbi:TPA: hypothetical protein PX804_003389 [Vibrio cholerae]|uniref:hypothetical protein n=2 Tax=Vibrio cholerae TaxID=666 RepID=UPI0015EF2A9C|nr:hypothetical protein [Vibrio cholerae]ELJ8583301.1 hypothetical protein [Vibrio cholerae]HDL9465392.1 hypothetical protein [Vibrio cholerae]
MLYFEIINKASMSSLISSENLEFIRTVIIVVGSIIAIKTYISGQKQRKLENSLKMLDLFHSNIQDNALESWGALFKSAAEPCGAQSGHYRNSFGEQVSLTDLFSEGPEDGGATNRITEQLNLLCHHMNQKTVDISVVYSNIGQLMTVIYGWYKEESFFKENYPYFEKFMRKNERNLKKLPMKTISYCE